MVVALGTAQQMKLDEARQLIEVTVAPEPALLESLLLALDHFKPIHRDKHFATPWCEGLSTIASFRGELDGRAGFDRGPDWVRCEEPPVLFIKQIGNAQV